MADKELGIIVRAKGTSAAAGQIKGVDTAIGRLSKRASAGLSKAMGNLAKIGTIAAGGVVTGIVAAVKAAGDFQAEMNTIATIVDRNQLPKIGTDLRNVAKQTGIGLGELSSAYYDLVSAGVKAADATSVLTDATHLAIGGLGTTGETVDLLTTAMNAYGLSAKGVTQATDMFAQAIADGKVKASEIAASFANIASIAKTSGVGIDQIAASYAYLTAQGVPATEVTTQMQRALISLLKPSTALAKAQRVLHINFAQEVRKKGLVPALQELRVYADKTHTPLMDLLGRVEAVKYALATTGSQEGGFFAELKKIHDSTGEASQQFAERQQGLNFQLARLKAYALDAGITIGSVLLPKITPLIAKLNELIQGHQGDIANFGDSIGRAFDSLLAMGQRIPWGAIGDSLRIAGAGGKALLGAFVAMPGWVQGAVLTGWGLNKLTGGALGGIIGELGKGLIKGVLGMNAGVVNINAGVVRGGGAGPGVVSGGKTGGLARTVATGLSVALAATAIAEAISTYFSVNQASSDQATDVHRKLDVQLQSNATTQDLQKSLAAIDSGIDHIQHDYFGALNLVAGNSLSQLEQMRAEVVAKIGQQTGMIVNADRWWAETATNTGRTTDRVEATRSALTAKQDAANASLRAIEAKRETNRINVTVMPQPVTLRLNGSAIHTAQITFKVRASGSAGQYAQ